MGFLSNLFSPSKSRDFNEVKVDRQVIDSIISFSKESYPNEFLALFDGFIKNKTLYIVKFIFIPGETGKTAAVFRSDLLPITSSYWGTVHSHPGPSASPSDADLNLFSKYGLFHMIICMPYCKDTFKAYNRYGEPMDYTIGDYSHLIEYEDFYDYFDEDDIVKDDEVIKAGFFDEEDFITDDEEEVNQYEEYEDRLNSQNVVFQIIVDKEGKYRVEPVNFKK